MTENQKNLLKLRRGKLETVKQNIIVNVPLTITYRTVENSLGQVRQSPVWIGSIWHMEKRKLASVKFKDKCGSKQDMLNLLFSRLRGRG